MAWAIPIHDYRIQLPSSWPTETGLKNVWVEEYKLGQSMLPHDVFSISMHLLLSHFKSKPCSFFTLYIHPRTITTNATHCKLHKQDNFYLIKDKKKYIFIFNIKKKDNRKCSSLFLLLSLLLLLNRTNLWYNTIQIN